MSYIPTSWLFLEGVKSALYTSDTFLFSATASITFKDDSHVFQNCFTLAFLDFCPASMMLSSFWLFETDTIIRLTSDMLEFLMFIFPCIMTQYTNMNNRMQLCRIIYYSLVAIRVSSDIFTHHQMPLNCITASGITQVCRCQLVPAGSDIRV
jgi:hypothetical protein